MAILGYKNSSRSVRDFGLAEWLKTRGFAGWLEMATDGLAASARQRIANEIEAHYAEAVSAHIAAGEPELSARAIALAELGDPGEAAINFRKSHLTECEAKVVKWLEWTAAKPLFSFWALLLDVIPFAGAALLFFHLRLLFDSHFYAGLLLVAYAGFRLIPRWLFVRTPWRNSLLGRLALCQFTTQAVVLPAFWLVPLTQVHGMYAAFNMVFIFYLYGYACNPGFRIWNKLRKMVDERNELLPPKTTAS